MQIVHDTSDSKKKPMQVVEEGKEEKLKKFDDEEALAKAFKFQGQDKLYKFLKLYNNNYRPIYHLESFIFYLCKVIYGLGDGM